MSFSLPLTKNNASYSGVSKNSTTFSKFLKHGKEPIMSELGDYTFESVVFEDGTQLKDITFEQLANIVWANISKS